MREGKFTDKELFSEYKNVLVEGWKRKIYLSKLNYFKASPSIARSSLPSRISPTRSLGFIPVSALMISTFVWMKKIADQTADSLELRPEDIFVCLDSALTDQSKMRLSDRTNLKIINPSLRGMK